VQEGGSKPEKGKRGKGGVRKWERETERERERGDED